MATPGGQPSKPMISSVRSACDNERRPGAGNGLQQSLTAAHAGRTGTFAQVRVARIGWSGTGSNCRPSAFQGERRPASQPLAAVGVADERPPRCAIISARGRPVKARPLRGRSASLDTAATAQGTAAVEEDGED
jgi:hypothetical protein